ncbi:hypothetical protein D9M69_727920 [compost metagenome]
MARGVNNFNFYFADGKQLTIFCYMSFKIRFCGGPVHNFRPRLLGEIDVAAHKVSMEMRFKDIFNVGLVVFGFTDIRGHLAERVNDGSFAFAADIVSPLGQASSINLF